MIDIGNIQNNSCETSVFHTQCKGGLLSSKFLSSVFGLLLIDVWGESVVLTLNCKASLLCLLN